MPIEIKEINIKADVYPLKKTDCSQTALPLTEAGIERIKRELTKEITQAVLQKIQSTIER